MEASPYPKSPSEGIPEADASSHRSIANAVQGGNYNAAEELYRDVALAGRSLLEDVQDKVKNGDVQNSLVQATKTQLSALDHQLRSLITGEMIQRPGALIHQQDDTEDQRETKRRDIDMSSRGSTKMVLTLYGGERSQKQLFSSLAKPGTGSIPLAEQPLPNGITATHIVPVHSLEEGKEKAPTIGQRFQPPSSIKPLNPPKQASKHTSTRSSSINWYNPAEASATAKEGVTHDTYPKQSLSTGRWLTYNVPPSSEQLTSPGSKRRHRERALSTGEPQTAISEEISAAHIQAKEDALFRSVYSSFAPNHDDFGAVITEEQKNRVWWSKYGEAQYEELLDARDEAAYGLNGSTDDVDVSEEQIDEKLIEEAIAKWVPSDAVGEVTGKQDAKDGADAEDADELLREISEMLEILNSHQHVRNLSQPTSSRTLQGQKEQLASLSASPTSPSAAEVDVYENLKSQLVDVIATLPPYMLAKLDGDKLGPLQLSTKIKIPGKNQKGTVEEDGHPVKAKVPAAAPYPTAYNAAAANARTGYTSTPPSQQYSRQPYTQPSAPRQAPVAATYSTSQYANRPASASQYTGGIGGATRPAYGGQYTQHRTTSSTFVDRYANGQYGHQQSPHSYAQYPNNYRPPVAQHSSYGQQYSTPQARVPPASTPAAQAYRASHSEYHPRAAAPPGYNYSAAQAGSSMSPNMKQGSLNPVQQRPQVYHQHSSHYGSQSPAPQTNGTNASGRSQMSPLDQGALIARQKQQIAEAQAQARQASGTPQPATGQSTQQNGTPVPQQDGVSA